MTNRYLLSPFGIFVTIIIFFFKNTCGKLDPGVLYFINFTAHDIMADTGKTICQIFTVPGVIAG